MTRRDLLEAESFRRRRLANALVTGSTDSTAPRHGRLAAWGLVLASLVVLGALAVRVLAPTSG
jgi:hypothetical protein